MHDDYRQKQWRDLEYKMAEKHEERTMAIDTKEERDELENLPTPFEGYETRRVLEIAFNLCNEVDRLTEQIETARMVNKGIEKANRLILKRETKLTEQIEEVTRLFDTLLGDGAYVYADFEIKACLAPLNPQECE